MSPIDTGFTVGQLVTERPARSRIFEEYGIDYCCGGKQPLEAACARAKVALPEVILKLETLETAPKNEDERDWSQASINELVDHILATHHVYLRKELPRIGAMVDKVFQVHGHNHPELARVRQVYMAMHHELDGHMMKEEQILFPFCKELEGAGHAPGSGCFGTVRNPIRMMEMEHDSAGEALREMRSLTGGYVPPADVCNTYRATLDGLREMEEDLHIHIHKENNILFPRVIALEEALVRQ